MILEIRLSNFFSIKNELVLDLRAANIHSQKSKNLSNNIFKYKEMSLLKTVAIYGANASGKSNIIKAIRFCCRMIFNSHNHNENVIFNFVPFKFDGYTNKPSSFFIRFVMNEIEYEYSFTLTQTEIITEELYFSPKNRRTKIFTRNEKIKGKKTDKYSFGSYIKRPIDVAENTSNKTLYISRASQMDRDLPKEIFRFFNEKFILDYFGFNTTSVDILFQQNKKSILKALQIADSDIIDIKIKKLNVPVKNLHFTLLEEKVTFSDSIQQTLKITTFHKCAPNVPFDFITEESAGTQNLFVILLSLLDIVKNNKILIIDEIEASLHTSIVEFIIKMFHKSQKAQLIFSTHNTNILNLDNMRKDQIYFTNKKRDGSTDLYSLFDYKDFRENMDVEKAYLQGRFDAIPVIDSSYTNLKSLIDD